MDGQRDMEMDGQLKDVLQAWEVMASLPLRFKEEVWRRIGQRERDHPRVWETIGCWVEPLSASPVWASAYLAGIVALSAWIGFSSAESYRAGAEQSWRLAYVQSVSPIAQASMKP